MKESEKLLIMILENTPKENRVYILQSYTQSCGGLSNEAGDRVKELLEEK